MKRFIGIFLILFTGLISFFLSTKVEAKDIYDPAVYENSDLIYLNGDINQKYLNEYKRQYSIDDYENELIGSQMMFDINTQELNIYGDDPIVNIIPRDYFINEGIHSANGDEYFYYIKTELEYVYCRGFTKKVPHSLVLLVNYEANLSDNTSYDTIINNCITERMEVIQYDYYTINLNYKFEGDYYLPANYAMHKANISVEDDIVIIPDGIVTIKDKLEFSQMSYYVLNNLWCSNTIINSYDTNQNNGMYFISAYSLYDAIEIETNRIYDRSEAMPNFINAAKNVMPLIKAITKTAGGKLTIASSIYSIVGYTAEGFMDLYCDETYKRAVPINNISEMNKIDLLNTTKKEQIDNYGHLAKTLIYKPNVYLARQNYIEYRFRYSCDSSDRIDSTIENTISFDIYNCISFDQYEPLMKCNRTREYKITSNNKIGLKIGEIVRGFNYKKTTQLYSFTPNNTQKYNINVTNNQSFVVKDSNNEVVDYKNGPLKKNYSYTIEVENKNDSYEYKEYEISINYSSFENNVTSYDRINLYLFTPNISGVYYFDSNNDSIDDVLVYYKNKYISIKEPLYYSCEESYKILFQRTDSNEIVLEGRMVDINSSESKYKRYEITSSNYYEVSGGDYYVLHDNLIRNNEHNEYLFNNDIVYSLDELVFTEAEVIYTIKVNDKYVVENQGILDELYVGDTINKIELYKKLSTEAGLGEVVDSYWKIDNKEETSYLIVETKMIIVYDVLNSRESIDFTIKPKPLDMSVETTIIDNKVCHKLIVKRNNSELDKDTDIFKVEVLNNNKEDEYIRYDDCSSGFTFEINNYGNCDGIQILINGVIVKIITIDEFGKLTFKDYNDLTIMWDYYFNSITKPSQATGFYYEINNELQFLAIIRKVKIDSCIYYDDGINDDESYFYGDAFTYNIKIKNNLNFELFKNVNIPEMYLNGSINAASGDSNVSINNLNIDNNRKYLFIENYRYIGNIDFINCSFDKLFKDGSYYGTVENVNIYRRVNAYEENN